AFLALAGVLARADWSLEDAQTFHRALYQSLWPANPELVAADTEVRSTFEKHVAGGGEITGVPTLVELVDKKVVDTALRWLGIDRDRQRQYHGNYTGNAARLADLHGRELVYCPDRQNYAVWTGREWRLDEFVQVEPRAE